MLVDLLKSNFIFQNIASWILSNSPFIVEHNVGKYQALKKALYLTALDQLDGDYLEFGVFTGSSFVLAMRAHKKLKFLGELSTKFYGFDSFSGFGDIKNEDYHKFYLTETFSVNSRKVIQNIKKKSKGLEVKVVEGFFKDTIRNKHPREFGISVARVVFVDCDMKEPAKLVFKFIEPIIQQGMILVMDDYYSYKGGSSLGVSGAFMDFCDKNPNIQWRTLFSYGYGGIAKIVSEI